MFALDSFGGDKTVFAQIGEFLIHLIPSFVLIVLLYFSWRHEIIGAIAFLGNVVKNSTFLVGK
jgi:hypothetical protein